MCWHISQFSAFALQRHRVQAVDTAFPARLACIESTKFLCHSMLLKLQPVVTEILNDLAFGFVPSIFFDGKLAPELFLLFLTSQFVSEPCPKKSWTALDFIGRSWASLKHKENC